MKCLYGTGWECRFSILEHPMNPPSIERCEMCIKVREAEQKINSRNVNLEMARKQHEARTKQMAAKKP